MDHIIEYFNDTVILSHKDIEEIRKYINLQYSFASKEDKLKLFTMEVHKHMDICLNGIDYNTKKCIKKKLLSKFVYEPTSSLYMGDVLNEIVMTAQDDTGSTLRQWIVRSTDLDLDDNNLISFIDEKSSKNTCGDNTANYNQSMSHNNSRTNVEEISNIQLKRSFPNFKLILKSYKSYISNLSSHLMGKKQKYALLSCVFLLSTVFFINAIDRYSFSGDSIDFYTMSRIANVDKSSYMNEVVLAVKNQYDKESYGIPSYLRYKSVNEIELKAYLKNRDSYLLKNDNYKKVLEISKKYDLSPYLLLAIIGQEQGFISNDNPHKDKIINNPFNVYHSWEKYNTDLSDSTNIACVTIINRLESRPKGFDPFLWLNETYAEDEKWWLGVKSLFYTLDKNTSI